MLISCGTSSRCQSDEWDLVESGSVVAVGGGTGISILVAAGGDTAVAAGVGAGADTIDTGPATGSSSVRWVVTSSLVFKPAGEASVP